MVAHLMKLFAFFSLLLPGLIPSSAWAQSLPDPTRPAYGTAEEISAQRATPYPRSRGLHSVLISAAHCAAIIDGRTVMLGAQHGNERLVEITAQGVVLQGAHGQRTLKLYPSVAMRVTAAVPPEKIAATCKFEQVGKVENPAKVDAKREKK